VGARGKRSGFSPGAAASHSHSASVQGRAVAKGFVGISIFFFFEIRALLTRSQPESTRIIVPQPLFSDFFDFILPSIRIVVPQPFFPDFFALDEFKKKVDFSRLKSKRKKFKKKWKKFGTEKNLTSAG